MSLEFIEEVETEFRVDRARRQVSGTILPWGKVAMSDGRKWRFSKGSLYWSASVGRVKLTRDHARSDAVGRAVQLSTRDDGVFGAYYVMRGDKGDAVLSEAEDGVLDGFSIGPVIEEWEIDPQDPDVRLVTKARLVETAITAVPAFDDARVTSVVMSERATRMSNESDDNKSKDGGKPTVLDNQDSAMERFEAELSARFDKLTEHVEESAKATGDAIAKSVGDAMTAAFSRLEDVDASGRGAVAAARLKVVSEPPVYRFDGDMKAPSLVKDAWRFHMDGDFDARDRLRAFQQQQQDLVKFATVSTSTASQAIPPGYRPDLYVTQLMQGRPLVSFASRGTIADATPFTVPRFVSAAGATADHAEGVNPTDGTLVLDQSTVTPGAISGRFDLTREIIDAANPAIDAIAMQAMRESWNRQTEQKAYAELNVDANVGFSTDQSLGIATFNEDVVNTSRDLLARYPFTRFDSPTGAVIGQRITRGFANAKDSTERPLLPSVGAQNTTGIGNAVQQGWFVDGLAFVPAWAITEAVGDELALIVNRSDWWVWESPLLTFRFEEKQGPAIVELALFGYYATRVLRPAGIFSIRAIA